ncbi:hypothetical protein ACQKP7_00580 [Pseudomonas frederiksbergensis]|uniref:DUF4148 domain-containing protein n=2 Tax=Pseudomonas TaxID=286 RepID=A0A6L5BU70_9PSED|nr:MULTISPECIES: hypothetical protein [Pseudomonas]KAF2391860.1 hypothetical protein FX983_06345 [Pseudomonas frederiksbergensis]KOX99275.1 hypothetical protein AM274_26495 [Pseudomonas nunensis]KPN90211.1 hypothetical protein AL066_07630 [Pseudomonas nunensis]MCL5227798.1 hypothetical protein [Pseudomonas nunensis]MDN3222445.1 hypothetical protein [Pseudomonas nunensis]
MKSIIGLTFALTVLGATSAMAATQSIAAVKVGQPATQNVNSVSIDTERKGSVNLQQNAEQAKLYVAENRPEFGSKYQRIDS